ncbi:hypothetical protein FOA52_015496 [Chlamydomonas sp. UWO 241]|nr:hypothetical protein FOA52_015496 [Chlamydomonas sp. UWO 241]
MGAGRTSGGSGLELQRVLLAMELALMLDDLGQAGAGGAFSDLANAFSERIHELKRFMHLRVDDAEKDRQGIDSAELAGLEASIKALEAHVSEIRAYIQSERTSMHKVEALLEACTVQSEDIAGLASVLQPALQAAPAPAAPAPLADVSNTLRRDEERGKRTARTMEPAPRWHVTEAEFEEVGQYMKGRLTLDKVNAAVDEAAAHADSMHRLITTPLAKLSVFDRAKATELLHSIVKREGVAGRHFFLEADLKEGNTLRLDKSGKTMMVLLRHLGRVQEVRATLCDQTCLVYVLQQRATAP